MVQLNPPSITHNNSLNPIHITDYYLILPVGMIVPVLQLKQIIEVGQLQTIPLNHSKHVVFPLLGKSLLIMMNCHIVHEGAELREVRDAQNVTCLRQLDEELLPDRLDTANQQQFIHLIILIMCADVEVIMVVVAELVDVCVFIFLDYLLVFEDHVERLDHHTVSVEDADAYFRAVH